MKHGKRNRKFQTWQPLLRGLLIILMVLSFDTLSAPIYATGNTNEIVLAGDTPFNIRSSKIIIATLEEALNRLGREFSPVLLPSKRALQVANDNQIDGLLHRVANFHEITNHQYPNLIRVESPVFSIYWSGFANDKDIQIDNWADLKNYTVGYMRGVVYVEPVNRIV